MNRRAFTLLEMLIALALTMALLAAMFTFLWDLLATRRRIIDETTRRRAVDTLVEQVERDLLTAVVGDRVRGSGVAGDATSLRILSRAVPVRLAGQRGNAGFLDLERSSYRFEASSGALTARRDVVRSGGENTGERRADAASPLGGTVHRVRFRYHDGRSWVESFDSLRAGRFPLAIEIAVWYDASAAETLAADSGSAFGDAGEPVTPAERLTFDPEAGFDERAFAIESDLDLVDEPLPDRVRVICLGDAIDESEAGAADAPVETPGSEELPR